MHMYICWSLPSNQTFHAKIASYRRPVGDHRVGPYEQSKCKLIIVVHVVCATFCNHMTLISISIISAES